MVKGIRRGASVEVGEGKDGAKSGVVVRSGEEQEVKSEDEVRKNNIIARMRARLISILKEDDDLRARVLPILEAYAKRGWEGLRKVEALLADSYAQGKISEDGMRRLERKLAKAKTNWNEKRGEDENENK